MSGDDPTTTPGSIGSRAKLGAVWTVLSFGGAQGLRLIANLIMTRLLFEEAFGIMALVTVFLIGLVLFSDIGIGPSIIQNKRGEVPAFLNTAWTIQVFRGTILWLIACAGARPFAALYGEPLLATILPVSGMTAFILGLGSTKLFTLNRNLYVGRLAVLELTSQAVGLGAMVVWALIDRSVWALVAGGLVSAAAKTVMSHVALPGERNRFQWSREDARALFRFGRWIFVSTAATFLALQSDRLIFGRLIPLGVLGVYHIGVTLASMPMMAAARLGSRVFFPLFSRVNESGQDLEAAFLRVRAAVLLVAGWVLSGMVAGGTAIIDTLYDDRYAQAGWIVQLTAVAYWLSTASDTYGSVLLSKGKSKWVAAGNGTKFVALVGFISLGWALFGFPGAVAGIILSELLKLLVGMAASSRHGVSGWKQDLGYCGMFALASLLGWLADFGLSELGAHVALRVSAVFVVVSLTWLPIGLAVRRRAKQAGSLFG